MTYAASKVLSRVSGEFMMRMSHYRQLGFGDQVKVVD